MPRANHKTKPEHVLLKSKRKPGTLFHPPSHIASLGIHSFEYDHMGHPCLNGHLWHLEFLGQRFLHYVGNKWKSPSRLSFKAGNNHFCLSTSKIIFSY